VITYSVFTLLCVALFVPRCAFLYYHYSDGTGELELNELQCMMKDIFGEQRWEQQYNTLLEINCESNVAPAIQQLQTRAITYADFIHKALGRLALLLKPVFLLQETFRMELMTRFWWKSEHVRLRRRCELLHNFNGLSVQLNICSSISLLLDSSYMIQQCAITNVACMCIE
jgi:hypothetical protein